VIATPIDEKVEDQMITRIATAALLLMSAVSITACGAGAVRTQAPAPVQTAVPVQQAEAAPASQPAESTQAQTAAPAKSSTSTANKPKSTAATKRVPAKEKESTLAQAPTTSSSRTSVITKASEQDDVPVPAAVVAQASGPAQAAAPAQQAPAAAPAPTPVQPAAAAQAAAPAQQAPASVQATAPARGPARTDSTTPATGEYRLGPGDTVKFTVYNNPDLTTEAEISEGGTISFPLIGEVTIGGLTRGAAERAVAAQLGTGGFVPNAHVNMLVLNYRSRQIAVMGEVNKPGNYPISKATSITEVLAMAGGISAKGADRITVIKKDVAGSSQRYELDVRKLLSSGDLSTNAFVDKDDIIFVPVAPVFYIYGEVRQPGAYPLAAEMTVRQALSLGGGLTVRGTERGIRLERKGKASESLSRRPHLDDRLQANDVLYVPESWF